MIVSTKKEIKRLTRSGCAVREALDTMAAAAKPGITTLELDKIGRDVLTKHGSRSAPPRVYQFPSDVCISINDACLHGPASKRKLENGDLLKLDLVAELNHVYTDAAITVIVGEGTETDRRLIECARQAFFEGLQFAYPGRPTNDIGSAVEACAKRYGFNVLEGFGGHGVGTTIHENPYVPNYFMMGCTDVLTEGMVITIEPIICAGKGLHYTADDKWTILTQDGERGAHFEHTIIVQKDGPLIVTD